MGARDTSTVPGTVAGIQQATETASAWTERQHLPPDVRRRLLTSLDELLSNIVHHGLRGRSGEIRMSLSNEAGGLEVEVVDDADPFNPLMAPTPNVKAGIDERVPGGLGIVLVRGLADDVRYERTANRNRVTLRFAATSNRKEERNAD